MVAVGLCEHPPGARYLDSDEVKCRQCGRSISFPPRRPTAADSQERRRENNAVAGQARRGYSRSPQPQPEPQPIPPVKHPVLVTSCYECRSVRVVWPEDGGPISCRGCDMLLFHTGYDGAHRLVLIDLPELVKCKACARELPTFCYFSYTKVRKKTGLRTYEMQPCRACYLQRQKDNRRDPVKGAHIRAMDQARQNRTRAKETDNESAP